MVLYELLTGRRPFCTESLPALLALVAGASPRSPRSIDRSIPRDLERICTKAMEKHPEDRFATAGELAEQLGHWLAREPVVIDLEPFLQAGLLLYEGTWVAERWAAVGAFIAEHPEAVLPVTREIIAGGARPSAAEHFAALDEKLQLSRTFGPAGEDPRREIVETEEGWILGVPG